MKTRMQFGRLSRVLLAVVLLATGVAVGAGSMALATHDNPSVYYACANNSNGAMRLVSETANCLPYEHKFAWNGVGQQGPPGPAGPQGLAGPEGPSGVVTIEAFAGPVNSIAGNSVAYVFAGPTASVTTTTGQRLTSVAATPLGLFSGGPQGFRYGVCYEPTGGGALTNFAGVSPSIGIATLTLQEWTAAATVIPGAGSWNVGFCVDNFGTTNMDNVAIVNGWVMVTND